MTMNLIVPIGEVKFNFFDSKKQFIESFILVKKLFENYSSTNDLVWL